MHYEKRNYEALKHWIDAKSEKRSKKFDELKTVLVKGYRGCWMEM